MFLRFSELVSKGGKFRDKQRKEEQDGTVADDVAKDTTELYNWPLQGDMQKKVQDMF